MLLRVVAALLAAPLALLLALLAAGSGTQGTDALLAPRGTEGYVGSAECATCHPDHHASWSRTFHRTMTQRPTPTAVRGSFDGRPVTLFGATARPFRDGDRFFLELPAEGGGTRIAEVALATGSRRYQQYFEKIGRGAGTCFRRLPLLWHIGEGRWMHLNGVFLEPDDDDWSVHASIWNENCIFCHTTAPEPGILNFEERADRTRRTYDSAVGELGIACETCHGPGAEHVARNRDPLHRYFGEAHKGSVAPRRLDHERSTALCAQCHGQRLPEPRDRIEQWLHGGPSFRPGDDLFAHVAPISRDTPPLTEEQPDLFRNRFWGDGTPRLTAHEYQGVSTSPCYLRGELSCSSCHLAHGGDPRGMIDDAMRGDRACTQCHAAIARDVAQHTGHRADGPGSRCLDCHMPRIVYGVLSVHRSHRIEVPDPARDGENGRPHACTLCHVDKTLSWSADAMNRIWGHGTRRFRAPQQRPDGAPLELPDAVASLLCGDPLQRAMYATALCRDGVVTDDAHRAEMHVLGIATLFDAYPALRWLTRESLLRLEHDGPADLRDALAAFDPLAPRQRREDAARALFGDFAATARDRFAAPTSPFVDAGFQPVLDRIVPLLRLQSRRAISIGE